MGATHLRAYGKIPGAEVIAVCARNQRTLEGELRNPGGNLDFPSAPVDISGLRRTTDWRDILADPSIHAVNICLPTDLHVEIAVAALEAGKHVLCEKPMALLAADCDRMLEAARRRDRVLMIAHVLRFWPEYKLLEQYVRSGDLGAVCSACFARSCGVPDWSKWLPDKTRSGGALLDLLVHDIDQVLHLFGWPRQVSACARKGVDAITADLIYEEAFRVQIDGGWLKAGTPFSMGFSIEFQQGRLDMSGEGLTITSGSGARRRVEVSRNDAYEAEVSYFVECCVNGNTPERCLAEESANAVNLALILERSRANGGVAIACSD